MKCFLVQPAWGQGRHFHMFEGTPPLGLAYVAAALLEAGHEVAVLDAVAEGWEHVMPYGPMAARGLPNDEVARRVPADAAVVGIGVISTTDWPLVIDLVDRIKAARPEVVVVLGGEHPSATPGLCLRTSRADFVVCGEGERTVVELVDALAAGDAARLREVAGLAWRDEDGGEGITQTPPRARIRDLEAIARPAWHLFPMERYQALGFVGGALATGRRSLPMLASRGCPYQCTFCTAPDMWAPLWVPRDAAAVVDEMEWLRDAFGVTDVSLHDLTTVVKRAWVVELCEEILARGLDVSWQLHSGTRLEALDDGLVALMKRAGLAYLVLAPESRSEATRARVGKRMDTADIERAIAAVLAAGLPLKVQLMTGLPGDGHEDAWQNVRFAFTLARRGVDAVGTAIFAPYPGSALFDELVTSGALHLGDDLVFFPVANNDFARPIIGGQRLTPAWTKVYQLLTLGSFIAGRFVFHPADSARCLVRALTTRVERRFFEKVLRALLTALWRVVVPPFTAPAVTWRPIDWTRVRPEDVLRRRRMSVARSPAQPPRPVTSAPAAPAPARVAPHEAHRAAEQREQRGVA